MHDLGEQMGLILKCAVKAAYVRRHVDICTSRCFYATSLFFPPNLDHLLLSDFSLLFLLFCSSLIFLVLLSGGAFQSVFSAAVLDTVDVAQTSGSAWSRRVCLSQQPPRHVVYIPRLWGLFILSGRARA